MEVLDCEAVMSLADRYVFFNQHLNLPRFTSEDEVSTAAQPAPSAPSRDGCLLPNLFAVITIRHWPIATVVLSFMNVVHE